jgi:hypothetical protein
MDSGNAACGDERPSNKPLEWTGHRGFYFDSYGSLPATQGQRSKDAKARLGYPQVNKEIDFTLSGD